MIIRILDSGVTMGATDRILQHGDLQLDLMYPDTVAGVDISDRTLYLSISREYAGKVNRDYVEVADRTYILPEQPDGCVVTITPEFVLDGYTAIRCTPVVLQLGIRIEGAVAAMPDANDYRNVMADKAFVDFTTDSTSLAFYNAKGEEVARKTVDFGITSVAPSEINGHLVINGVDNTVYEHPTTHPADMITGLSAVATSGDKADIGLGNVDNTSDADKPISTAQQAALDGKADAADVLTKTNITAFTPTGDYQPATKKYVDDAVEAGGGGGGGDAQKVYSATWTAASETFTVTGVTHITALEEGASIRVEFPSITGSHPYTKLKVNDLAAASIYLDALRTPNGFGVNAVHDLVYHDGNWVVVGANTAHNATFTGDFNLSNSTDVGLSDYVRFVAESEQSGMNFTVHDDVDYNYVRIGVTANPVSIPTIKTYDMLAGTTQSGVFYTSINDPMMVYDAILAPGSMYTLAKTVAHITALSDGVQVRIRFDAAASNATININGLGAKSIYANSAEPAEIKAGMISDLAYYDDKWYVVGG